MGPPGDLRTAKRSMRSRVIARRGCLPGGLGQIYGALASHRLACLPGFVAAQTVLAFASFRGEIPTGYLLRGILSSGKSLVLPAVRPGSRELVLRSVVDLEKLDPGIWGIPEPPGHWPEITESAVDFVVAPGVAFDLLGNRLGYGGGYYDALITRLRGAGGERGTPVFGFAYELQVVPSVPAGPGDRRVDGLVTERRTYDFREPRGE